MNNSFLDNWPKPPGLIRREIVGEELGYVTIRELWDLTVDGCPIVSVFTPKSECYCVEKFINKLDFGEMEKEE